MNIGILIEFLFLALLEVFKRLNKKKKGYYI